MKIVRIAIGVAALAAAVLTGVPASSASADVTAATPIQYITNYFWGGTTGVVTTGTVACPSGTRIVSSGASAGGVGGELTAIEPDPNSFTSATATARAPGYLQITVGCEPTAALTEVTSRTVELPAGTTGFHRAVAYCPAGMHAFGGGGFMAKPFGAFSRDSFYMVSNSITADGNGWTFAASSYHPLDHLVVTTQCAPFRGGYYVSQTGVPSNFTRANVFGSCSPGYTALSGGFYLSRPDGNEVKQGFVDYSMPIPGNRWYVDGQTLEFGANKIVALEQCIIR